MAPTEMETLESVIDHCGGFGRFQSILVIIVIGSKIALSWSMLIMVFTAAVPDWTLMYENANATERSLEFENNSYVADKMYINYSNIFFKECGHETNNASYSVSFKDDINTVVNEWTLVCDKSWIPPTMTTIQMTGHLFGVLSVGYFADLFGRKPVYILSIAFSILTILVAGFAVTWHMFIILRFFIGFFNGCFSVVINTFPMEFLPSKYRALLSSLPILPLAGALFGALCFWLRNWRHIHIATALCFLPFFFCWRLVPESFRWLVSRNKVLEAQDVIKLIARINNKTMPDVIAMPNLWNQNEMTRKYNVCDILKTKHLRKITFCLGLAWLSCSYTSNAITFGVQSLSGNFYVNIVFISLIETPAVFSYYLTNRIGRRATSILFLSLTSLSAFITAVLQIIDPSVQIEGEVRNGLILICKLAMSFTMNALILITTESYPTVVRNIGYGLQSTVGRIGSMIAPQILLLNDYYPSVVFFLCGGLNLASAICLVIVPETRGQPMPDMIRTKQ